MRTFAPRSPAGVRALPDQPHGQTAAVRHILRAPRPQAKLAVGAPDDAFEKPQGSGEPLPASERAFFEPRFGRDFSGVRLVQQGGGEEARTLRRSPDDDVLEANERMRDETRRHIREGLRNKVDDLQQFPFSTKDPDRGFRPQDLAQLDKAGVSLTFAGSLSPLPADAQKLLLDNIAGTVRFALDPKNPTRVAELKRLQAELKAQGKADQFFDQPAGRLDATDLYHGHICVPKPVLDKSKTLQKLRQSPYSGFGSGASAGDDLQKAIGKEVPTTRPQARDVMEIVGRHREPFLKALAPLLKAVASEPEAGILYHSWEVDRPKIGKRDMPSDNPVRTIFTPFSTRKPGLGRHGDCQTLINFAFHVDRRGRITLFPGSEKGMVRALEILRGWGTPP